LKIEKLEMELAAAKNDPKKDQKNPDTVKVTHKGVEYEFIDIVRDGNEAKMRLAVTATDGDAQLLHQLRIQLIAKDGTEYASPIGTSGGRSDKNGQASRLTTGVRKVIEFDLGELPAKMNVITTIILPGKGGEGLAKANKNPVVLKGEFKVK
jgi:hypothetical protein